ncbi:MAG: HAMP domain-containing histidine kinase [Eubacterium sp.]|nr:HAMP domain-containing histidine kinase [Eubacterium sp.]
MSKDRYIKRRYRSLNAHMVLYVFLIMVTSGTLSMIIFNILYSLGVVKGTSPMLLLLVTLSVSTIIGSILTVIFSGVVLRPMIELSRAMQRVAKGDFNVKINELSRMHEMQLLQKNFNIMTREMGSTEMFRNDFINGFSHEFKTPMVSVYGFAKQLKKGGLTEQQQDEYIDIILSESQRLINMSGNILTLNKLENQEIVTDKSTFRLDEEIRRSILLLEQQWSRKSITVIPELEETEFYGNAEMLKQVWLNVIGNAIKYTDEDGEITVTLSKEPDNEVKIAVCDNGIGMDKETAARIFEKFYRGDSSRTSSGNGLGLPMVKRIIELCRGTIKVISEPGRGTEFYIFLPIETPEKEPWQETRRKRNSDRTEYA